VPRLDVPIDDEGPIIEVRIWIGHEHEMAIRAVGLTPPQPLSVRGLVDTGARMTAINFELARMLKLPVNDWVNLRSSVSGQEEREAPVYPIRMTFGPIGASEPIKWRTIHAVGVTLVTPGALALIGQDMLATCRFTYDGRKRRLMMSY
jgi:hypothetical protein